MAALIVTATVILDFQGRMLLGKRTDNGLYGPPGGKLDKDEHLKAGTARELREETGIRVELHDLIELGFCERTDNTRSSSGIGLLCTRAALAIWNLRSVRGGT